MILSKPEELAILGNLHVEEEKGREQDCEWLDPHKVSATRWLLSTPLSTIPHDLVILPLSLISQVFLTLLFRKVFEGIISGKNYHKGELNAHDQKALILDAANLCKEFITVIKCKLNSYGGHTRSNHYGTDQIHLRVKILIGVLAVDQVQSKNDHQTCANNNLASSIDCEDAAILVLHVRKQFNRASSQSSDQCIENGRLAPLNLFFTGLWTLPDKVVYELTKNEEA